MKNATLLFLLGFLSMNTNAQLIYRVSFPEANKHYVHVEIELPKKLIQDKDSCILKVPVWTPGSYKVREFSRNLDRISAKKNKSEETVTRLNKNSWRISNSSKGDLVISYDIYAFEYGVRESYVDDEMAFLHGVSTFAYIEGYADQSIKLYCDIPSEWKAYSSMDPGSDKNFFTAENYDLLVDSPIAFGDFETAEYESGGTPHTVVMIGRGNYDLERVQRDFKKISDTQVDVFGGKHPSPRYVHFIQHTDQGGGGLEHLNSQTSQVNRFVYSDEEKYKKFLGLISHEYFHLWNVKRIRPIELGPFDYDQEVYTDMLWIAEGITSYYDDLILKRAGLHTEESYLKEVAFNINRLENLKGNQYMSLAESSKTAWVKAYLPNENSKNVTVSYYNKGMVVALLLDQLIKETTRGNKSMDDLLRNLYYKYYLTEKRGFTHREFIKTCEELVDLKLDYFFDDYVFGTKKIDYSKVLYCYGLTLEDEQKTKVYSGISTKFESGKLIVTSVEFDSPGVEAGISANDEIVAVEGWQVGNDLESDLARFSAGQTVSITGFRKGKMYTRQLTLEANPKVNYTLKRSADMTELQKLNLGAWLN